MLLKDIIACELLLRVNEPLCGEDDKCPKRLEPELATEIAEKILKHVDVDEGDIEWGRNLLKTLIASMQTRCDVDFNSLLEQIDEGWEDE
jgi:hypothetical protein